MKITALKTYPFSVPTGGTSYDPHSGELLASTMKSWLFVKLETDAGISGWGEGSGEWLVPQVETMLQELWPLLIDRDPTQVEALCEDLCNRSPWKGGAINGRRLGKWIGSHQNRIVGGLRLINAGVSAGFTRWQLEHAEPGTAPINDGSETLRSRADA